MSKKQEIRVPDIGDFDKVPVIEVLVAEGDEIEAEQSLVTLESDKATMEVPSSATGKVLELKVKEGDEVGEGDVIAVVEVADGGEKEKGEGEKNEKGEGEKDGDRKSEDGGRKTEDGKESDDAGESEKARPETGNP